LKMLHSIIELKKNLSERISQKQMALVKSVSQAEKLYLKSELDKLDKSLADVDIDFERIATGVDVDLLGEKTEKPFNWQDEVVSLIEPGIMELKHITEKAREKTKLKDELSSFQDLLPIVKRANKNLQDLLLKTNDTNLKKNIKELIPEWQGIENQFQNKVEIIQLELAAMEAQDQSLVESTQTFIKNFFKNRGFFLFIAIVACIGLFLFLRFSYLFMIKFLPGYNAKYRPFHIRVMDLFSRIMIVVLILSVLIFVFYSFEDWVLLSLTIIFFLGLGWAVKHTLPKFWHQSRLMLNIGAVREGERIVLHGVPWMVKNINMFTKVENPYLDITLRLPIEKLLDKVSRPFHKTEPWFPCKRNDWVILADGTRGCVTSLSHETVELVQRGGARKVYQTADFLAQTPLNLSANFRLKIPFGISYDLQTISTNRVLDTLDSYIRDKIEQEGYETSMLNLRVEFFQAGGSSLDLIVIADFKGEMAHLYSRLSRAIQRWCVDACTENGWEIPFPQLTVHKK
ncbi:MAG: hypothetical protein ABFR31_11435, partial [Thermodesulfobacteriota bacterium]